MSLEQKYYSLLGLSPTASLNELKKAYRAKAKQLHPDKNPSPNAEEEFIELQEAYEYLEALKSGKRKANNYKQVEDFERWWYAEAARRKQRAREQAKMRYEEYINSPEYKLTESFDHVTNVFFGLVAFAILIVNPVLGYIYGRGIGIAISVGVIVMTLPITLPVVTQLKKLKLSLIAFRKSIITLFTYPWLRDMYTAGWPMLIVLAPINILIIFKIAINTLITINTLWAIYIVAIIVGFVFSMVKKHQNENVRYLYAFGIAPLILSLLFFLNYTFSTNPKQESYFFSQTIEIDKRRNEEVTTSYIILENDAYEDYKGLRFFLDYSELQAGNQITYTFETGLLGIRVMKKYEIKYILNEDNY